MKFNTFVLLTNARKLVADADVGCSYHIHNSINGKLIENHLTIRCIQSFMSANRIVMMSQCGKLIFNTGKQLHIERSIDSHLSELSADLKVAICTRTNVRMLMKFTLYLIWTIVKHWPILVIKRSSEPTW